jgi:hypothetical protein
MMVLDKEIWIPINGFETIYSISSYGRIRRDTGSINTFAGKIFKQPVTPCGYISVSLSNKGKRETWLLHRLVMNNFIGKCPKDKEVNHIDGNKLNNHVSNLEYITKSQNHKHAFSIGIKKAIRGSIHVNTTLNEDQVLWIRKNYKKYNRGGFNLKNIADKFNIDFRTVGNIIKRVRWGHI